jgi:DNA-binding FrmR family transcriptional regulator
MFVMMAGVTAVSAGRRIVRVPALCVIHQKPALETYTLGGYIERMRKDIKTSVQKRLGRIEGQVRGLSKMVDDDRYCIDIVTQISAVRAALRRVEEEVLRDHVAHCVEHAITSGNKADQREKIAELIDVIGRSDR